MSNSILSLIANFKLFEYQQSFKFACEIA